MYLEHVTSSVLFENCCCFFLLVVQGSPFPTQHKSLSAYPKGSPLTTPGGGLLCKSLGRGVPMKPLPYTRP